MSFITAQPLLTSDQVNIRHAVCCLAAKLGFPLQALKFGALLRISSMQKVWQHAACIHVF